MVKKALKKPAKKLIRICAVCFDPKKPDEKNQIDERPGTVIQRDGGRGPWYCYDCGEDRSVTNVEKL